MDSVNITIEKSQVCEALGLLCMIQNDEEVDFELSSSAKKDIAFCVFLEHGGSSQNATLVSKQFLLNMKQEEML